MLKEPLTKKEHRENLNRCPVCGSEDITGSFVEIDDDVATQEVSCNECDAEWTDLYKLFHYVIRKNL